MRQMSILFRCTFGLRSVPCESAHNYFWDPDPVVDARGPLVAWPNGGCPGSPATAAWAAATAALSSSFEKELSDEGEASVIVFVLRGECSFADKVLTILNVASHDATARPMLIAAVVIVDVPPPARLGGVAVAAPLAAPGLGDVHGIHVPVVMVAHADAEQLFPGQFHGPTSTGPAVVGAAVGPTVAVAPANAPHTASEASSTTVVNEGGHLTGAVVLVSATLDSLRGRGQCQCSVEAPLEMAEWHLMHREG